MAVDNHHDPQSEPDWTILEQFSPTTEGKHLGTPQQGLHTPTGIKHWAGTEELRANPGCGANYTTGVTVCSDTYLVCGKKPNVQKMGAKNQSGPRETGCCFNSSSSCAAAAEGEQGKGSWTGWLDTFRCSGCLVRRVWCCRTQWWWVTAHQQAAGSRGDLNICQVKP